MDILCHVLFILWFGFLVACAVGYVVDKVIAEKLAYRAEQLKDFASI